MVESSYRKVANFAVTFSHPDAAMANASLWQIQSAERIVFETSTRVAESASSFNPIPSKAEETFGIAVPNCRVRSSVRCRSDMPIPFSLCASSRPVIVGCIPMIGG